MTLRCADRRRFQLASPANQPSTPGGRADGRLGDHRGVGQVVDREQAGSAASTTLPMNSGSVLSLLVSPRRARLEARSETAIGPSARPSSGPTWRNLVRTLYAWQAGAARLAALPFADRSDGMAAITGAPPDGGLLVVPGVSAQLAVP